MTSPRTIVYTDGACSGNPGPGGWAWAVPGGRWASGYEPATTNQQMELRAVVEALRSLDGDLHIVTDSTYVKNCFQQRWFVNWERNGWRNSQKKPVANQELWKPLIDAFRAGRIDVPEWVKGHSGHAENDFVDSLAVAACRDRRGASGPT